MKVLVFRVKKSQNDMEKPDNCLFKICFTQIVYLKYHILQKYEIHRRNSKSLTLGKKNKQKQDNTEM